MEKIKKGDVVGRISYDKDILFEVKKLIKLKDGNIIAILKGLTERIEADSNINDLYLISKDIARERIDRIDTKVEKRILKEQKEYNINEINSNRIKNKIITGKILHLDGDKRYSEKSMKYYKKMGVNAIVKNVSERMQPKLVYNLLSFYKPDILVMTGHDGMIRREIGYNDIYNYRNSRYFIEAVKEARRYEKDYNLELVIFAGACQSYFEAIMMAGANFASSPARILIDILDPLIVAERVANTSFNKYISIDDIEGDLRDGKKGISGIGARRKKTLVIFL